METTTLDPDTSIIPPGTEIRLSWEIELPKDIAIIPFGVELMFGIRCDVEGSSALILFTPLMTL